PRAPQDEGQEARGSAASTSAMRRRYQNYKRSDRVRARQTRERWRRLQGHSHRQPGLGNFKLAVARRRVADRAVNRNDFEGGRSGDRAALGSGTRRGGTRRRGWSGYFRRYAVRGASP